MHAHTHKLTLQSFCRAAAPASSRGANHQQCQPVLLEALFFHGCWLGRKITDLNAPSANEPSKNYQKAETQFYSQQPPGKTLFLNFKWETRTKTEKLPKKIARKAERKKRLLHNFSAQCFASSAHVIFCPYYGISDGLRAGHMSHWSV